MSKRFVRSPSALRAPPPYDGGGILMLEPLQVPILDDHALEPLNVGEWQGIVVHHHPAELGAAAQLGEDLAGIEQMVGIEGAFDPHLLVEVDLGELHIHQVALLDADAMLAGQHAADAHAQAQDIRAKSFGPLHLA